MVRLAIRIWFFTMWDRLGVIFVSNIVFLGFLSLLVLVPFAFLPAAMCILFSVSWVFSLTARLFDVQNTRAGELFTGAVRQLPAAVFWLAGWTLSVFLLFAPEPFFLAGAFLGLFWFFFQGWLGATSQMKVGPGEAIKQAWLLTWDNPGLGLALVLGSVVLIAVSALGLGFFPGFAGMVHWWQVLLRLRREGYAWQRVHPEKTGKMPWKEILAKETEHYRNRTIKSLIFPWK